MSNKISKTFLPILWMGLIFYLSDQPYDFYIIETTNAQQILAHIFLYTILSYLLVGAILNLNKNYKLRHVLIFSMFFSIFYGITDEYHQSFVPGRFVSGLDLVFDSVGAFLGTFLFTLKSTSPRFAGEAGSPPLIPPTPFIKGEVSEGQILKPKLLLHICCIGCGAYVVSNLKKDYRVVLYYFNPNIFPKEEYEKRLNEAKKIANKFNPAGAGLIVGEYNHNEWLKTVKGHEKEPEGGERCLICYRDRLEESAKKAKELGINYFTTTLTISPHKDSKRINKIGNEISMKYRVKFLNRDFKKQDGFRKTCELSKELGLYRQNYCGCEFSKTNTK